MDCSVDGIIVKLLLNNIFIISREVNANSERHISYLFQIMTISLRIIHDRD
jgi:hypothetical protein